MAESPYERSIDQAARTLTAANADWQRISDLMAGISATDASAGGAREAEYKNLANQLDAAAKRFNESEKAYQDAIQLADRASTTAKEYPPAGTPRRRLDTSAGNVLVVVTEKADGRGGWTLDTDNLPSKIDIPGVTANKAITAAPTSKYILKDGKIEENEAYEPPKPTAGGAVPTSEFVYDENGKPVKNVAYRGPGADQTPEQRAAAAAAARTAAAGATTAEAQAATAGGTAEAALRTAQANADKAAIDLANAQRASRQAPTDQQAQAAIASAQRAADLANQQLEQTLDQSSNLNPIAVQQARATLERTKQTTQQAQLGDLYGRPQQIQQIRDLIASGDVKPVEGDAMIGALNRGTTVYDALKQTQADRQTARTTTGSNLNQLASTFGSTLTSGFNTLADMNKYATPGSTAGADAFVGLMNMAQERLKAYQLPEAQQTDYHGAGTPASPVGGLASLAQQMLAAQPTPPPAPPMATPPPAPSAGQPITINISGAGAPQTAQAAPPTVPNVAVPAPQPTGLSQPYETAQQSTQRNLGGLTSAAATRVPATPDDIYSAYGVEPQHRRVGGQQWG
jgi:hypothetical protein